MKLLPIPEHEVLRDTLLTPTPPATKPTLLGKTWQWIQKHEKMIATITLIATSILTGIFTSGLFLPIIFGVLGGAATFSLIEENLPNTPAQEIEDIFPNGSAT